MLVGDGGSDSQITSKRSSGVMSIKNFCSNVNLILKQSLNQYQNKLR